VEELTTADLGAQRLRREVHLVDLVRAPVLEDTHLPAFAMRRRPGLLDENQLGRDPARLQQEPLPIERLQMVEEAAAENTLERALGERQRRRLGVNPPCMRQALTGEPQHGFARVEQCDLATQVLGQEARAAADVERVGRRKGGEDVDDLCVLDRLQSGLRLQRSTVMATLVEGVQVAPLDATYIM